MSRIVSVWLRAWPIARLLQAARRRGLYPSLPAGTSGAPADGIDPARPLVLVAPAAGGPRITARNRAAQQAGLAPGELLSNARAKVHDLQVRDADPAADAEALRRLALWAIRYTPTVAVYDAASGADGLFLDITGCAHLFGGEPALLADLARRLAGFGLAPRIAVADTPGAAWAVSHYGPEPVNRVPEGQAAAAVRPLPLAGLRLPAGALRLLRRLGLKRIADVMEQPRAPFAARFEAELLARLDQALGRAAEPLLPVLPAPCYHAQTLFLDPIFTSDHVLLAARRLLDQVGVALGEDGMGARRVRLVLFRVEAKRSSLLAADGGMLTLDIGLAAPSRDAEHIARLIGLRLERLGQDLDTDFGFEGIALHILLAEPLAARQHILSLDARAQEARGVTALIDRLRQRLGPRAVQAFAPRQSHVPERAVAAVVPTPAADPAPTAESWKLERPVGMRPQLLLPQPEIVEVLALIPDGPPRQFRWRGVLYQVRAAQGPERIGPEWWRRTAARVRDYYVVEDAGSRRFWLYREGLYEPDAEPPVWYVQGAFA